MHLYAHGHPCPCCLGVEEFVQTSWPAPPPQFCRCQRCGYSLEHVREEPEVDALLLRRWKREDELFARSRGWR